MTVGMVVEYLVRPEMNRQLFRSRSNDEMMIPSFVFWSQWIYLSGSNYSLILKPIFSKYLLGKYIWRQSRTEKEKKRKLLNTD